MNFDFSNCKTSAMIALLRHRLRILAYACRDRRVPSGEFAGLWPGAVISEVPLPAYGPAYHGITQPVPLLDQVSDYEGTTL
jgi:hypothetical protein